MWLAFSFSDNCFVIEAIVPPVPVEDVERPRFFGHLITGTIAPEVFDGQASTVHRGVQA